MRHPEPDTIAALVLGEPGDTAVADHIRTCPTCSVEASRLTETSAAVSRLQGELVTLERPPAHVWDRIAAAIAEPESERAPEPGPAFRLASPLPAPGRRRARGVMVAALGFAVGVAATLAVGLVVQRDTDGSDVPAPVAVERTLERGVVSPLQSTDTQGRATIVQVGQGWELRVRLDRKPQVSGGFVQAWMLDPSTDAMIALGVLDGKDGTFALPGDLDLTSYTSVDLSLEPFDGNPVHSAVSLARGPLTPLPN